MIVIHANNQQPRTTNNKKWKTNLGTGTYGTVGGWILLLLLACYALARARSLACSSVHRRKSQEERPLSDPSYRTVAETRQRFLTKIDYNNTVLLFVLNIPYICVYSSRISTPTWYCNEKLIRIHSFVTHYYRVEI